MKARPIVRLMKKGQRERRRLLRGTRRGRGRLPRRLRPSVAQ